MTGPDKGESFGLVHQNQHIGIAKAHFQKQYFCLLAAGQFADGVIHLVCRVLQRPKIRSYLRPLTLLPGGIQKIDRRHGKIQLILVVLRHVIYAEILPFFQLCRNLFQQCCLACPVSP